MSNKSKGKGKEHNEIKWGGEMNGARRWKEFVAWWDSRFPAQSGINKKYTASHVINEIEDKIFA